jgi:hypothetical protein
MTNSYDGTKSVALCMTNAAMHIGKCIGFDDSSQAVISD